MNKFCGASGEAVCRGIMTFTLIVLASTALNAQSGWKTVKDKTGSCQISVPPTWTPLSIPGLVNSPQQKTSMLTSGNRPFRPFSDQTFKVLNVGKVLENSATRILYADKPSGNPAYVNYHVEVPGKVNSCIAQITLQANTPEDDAKAIAFSLSKTP
jgi:PPE-repeat protein